MKALPTANKLQELISIDQVTRKGDLYTFRSGYFYRMGRDENKVAARISKALTAHGYRHEIVDKGDHWAAFNGGASIARSSHFWVKIRLISDDAAKDQTQSAKTSQDYERERRAHSQMMDIAAGYSD